MGIFQLFGKRKGLEEGLEQAEATPNSVIIDVRTKEEYRGGHVPKSKNIPLDEIRNISLKKENPLFVYCYSGARAENACALLRQMGYNATNIGGIAGYKGNIE